MSYSSNLTKERILTCAKEEFLKKDFINANIRTIAKNANVTTGALYNHFKNKETLFDALVSKFSNELLELFETVHSNVPEHLEFIDKEKKDSMSNGSFLILEFVYNHLNEAKLLFFHSNGTKYENFVDKLVEIEENASIKALEIENFDFNKVNRFFVHIMAVSGINNMLETINHNLSKEEAFYYMEKIHRFYYAGTKEILGQ